MQVREPNRIENVMDDREKTAASTDNATVEEGQSISCPCLKTSQTITSNCNCSILKQLCKKIEENAQMQDFDVRRYSLVLLI
jgi:hypothetical protein